jgi:hypothetical protein
MIALVLCLLTNADPPAADRGHTFTRAGIVCTEIVDPATVPLTGEVRLTISVDGEAPLVVEPVLFPDPPGWRVRATLPTSLIDRPGGRQRWQASFRLVPDNPGDLALPPSAIRVRAGGRETPVKIDWQPLPVRVTTTLSRVDLDEARGVTGPEPAPPTTPPLWMDERVWAVGIVGIAVATAVFVGRGLRPPPAREPPLDEWTAGELERLSRLDPAKPETADALAELLRGVLSRRFQLPVTGKTTSELIALLCATAVPAVNETEHGRDGRGTPIQTSWQTLLERCELARFANKAFTIQEWKDALTQTQQLIAASLPVDQAAGSAAVGPTGEMA